MRSVRFGSAILTALVLALVLGGGRARTAAPSSPPLPDDAAAFLKLVDEQLLLLGTAANRAGWVQNTYITQDTEIMGAQANEALVNAATAFAKHAAKFQNAQVAPAERIQGGDDVVLLAAAGAAGEDDGIVLLGRRRESTLHLVAVVRENAEVDGRGARADDQRREHRRVGVVNLAFAEGGAVETVTHGETGVLFHQPTAAGLKAAVDSLSGLRFNTATLRARAEAHSRPVFEARFRAFVEGALRAG